MAIILKSLPDSVFNYFHNHTHVSVADPGNAFSHSIVDYKYNCHIEDWNFESFDVTENNHVSFQHASKQIFTSIYPELVISIFISQNDRGPPVS